jgi:hypothetical protein
MLTISMDIVLEKDLSFIACRMKRSITEINQIISRIGNIFDHGEVSLSRRTDYDRI